ncbi:MAG TPA: Hsp70 family protein [Planctomycetaceae bacterium]|nr:Hsp70 family protein [Planctomycetaceae bacterium]
MLATHAVGIDLGTTYSCIAYLNEHGEPVTIPNQEGELSTPSVVLFESDGSAVVGTEALRNAIIQPDRVVQNAKRSMGDPHQKWTIDGRSYTPADISALVLKKLLDSAEKQLGGPVQRAVITVPAQFSDIQRQCTVEAGLKAGLQQVDIINEPVAAALCYVLGNEGLWFSEIANEQRVMVYDLGGGTFDLSLVKYHQNEVRVIASSGDLHLGGIDWNKALIDAVAGKFQQEFGDDPRKDPESLQYLSWEAEQTKRSLTVRPRAAISCQHRGQRKTYQIEREKFAKLTEPLVRRTEEITRQLLKDNNLGWAHVDVVLTTGGSSRMPMVRDMLKNLSGRTLNTSLSPDQSIAHGATYYAGMLLSNSEFVNSILNAEASARLSKVKQQSVNARGLGILVREPDSKVRIPHYLIPANPPLPASITQTFGTVIPNQKRVHLQVIESGARPDLPHVSLGACVIESLAPNLPKDSEIAVTISYDASARVHVSARDVISGKEARTEIVRPENVLQAQLGGSQAEVAMMPPDPTEPVAAPLTPVAGNRLSAAAPPKPASPRPTAAPAANRPKPAPAPAPKPKPIPSAPGWRDSTLESSPVPIPLCNSCGEPLDSRGTCPACGPAGAKPKSPPPRVSSGQTNGGARPKPAAPAPKPLPPKSSAKQPSPPLPGVEDEILELPARSASAKPPTTKPKSSSKDDDGDEFWSMHE